MTTENKNLQCAALIIGTSLLITSSARAQHVDPRVAPIAQKLYEDGVALMDRKKFSDACPKLEQVTKLVPSGIGGHEALGDCYLGQKRLASAWGQYVQLEALARAAGRRETAVKAHTRVENLRPKLATVKITVPAAMLTVPGLSVKMNGLAHEQKSWGTAIPVDAGKHEIQASAPGYITDKRTMKLAAGQGVTIELSLAKDVVSPRRVGAYVAGGVGIAGLVVGGVTGGLVLYQSTVIDKNCGIPAGIPIPNACNKAGINAYRVAQDQGLVSTISFGVGAAGIATAAILMITEHKRSSAAPSKVYAWVTPTGYDGAIFGFSGVW